MLVGLWSTTQDVDASENAPSGGSNSVDGKNVTFKLNSKDLITLSEHIEL